MLSNEINNSELSSSDEEINLDVPMISKKKFVNRILSESDDNEDEVDRNNLDSSSVSSDNESESMEESPVKPFDRIKRNSKTTTKEPKKQEYLSTEWIVDSDTDDGGANHDPSNPAPPSSSPIKMKKNKTQNKAKAQKSPKNEFKRASEDFKSTLKLMSYGSEEEESDVNDADLEDDNVNNSQESKNANSKPAKIKKPKETLKSVLKESEALLRRLEPVELPINVSKPKSLSLILSEALAANSRSPVEARKRVIEEKRKIQRARLEKLLGAERMARLSLDDPKIGQSKLDESIEIDIKVDADEKAVEGGEEVVEKVKVKLVDLPDKHFNSNNSRSLTGTPSKRIDSKASGYRVHLQTLKKASIETLNRQLQEKIQAQSSAFMAHHQREREIQIAAKRAEAAKKEQKRRMKEAQKEKELREKREKKAEGSKLFKSDQYEGIERPSVSETEITGISSDADQLDGLIKTKKAAVKIILSDDSEDFSDSELLNLEEAENCDSEDGLDGLLSGKFESEASGNETVGENNNEFDDLPEVNLAIERSASKQKVTMEQPRKQSAFIDDEASDEDEVRDAEEIDELALQEEMLKSKFIASDDSEVEGDDEFELIKFVNEKRMKEDLESTRKYAERYQNHLDEEGLADEMGIFDDLGLKYGLINYDKTEGEEGKAMSAGADSELKKLLLQQKKRKLEALGPNPLRTRRFDLDDSLEAGEFRFKTQDHFHSTSEPDFYTDESSNDSAVDDSSYEEDDLYERQESGLQSKVNEEADFEEEQVRAAVDLDQRLKSVNILNNSNENNNENSVTTSSSTSTNSNTNTINTKSTSSTRPQALSVPKADAKFKAKLMALQGETEETGNNAVFKGFTYSSNKH